MVVGGNGLSLKNINDFLENNCPGKSNLHHGMLLTGKKQHHASLKD
jgi:hypothetical protein